MQEIPTEDDSTAAVSGSNINVNIHQPDAEHNKLPSDEDKQPISTSTSSHSKNNSSASQSDSLAAMCNDSSQTSEQQTEPKANNIQSNEQKEPKVNNLTTAKDSEEKNVVLAKQNNLSAAASMTSLPTTSHKENNDVTTSTPQTWEEEMKR